MQEYIVDIAGVLASTLRFASPLLLAAMGGILSERAGIIDIGLEGKMLFAAFFAAAAASVFGSAWLGLLAAMVMGVVMGVLHAFATVTHHGNQVVSGLALNFIAAGLTLVLAHAWFGMGGQTPTLSGEERFAPIVLPWVEQIGALPVLGPLYTQVVSGHTLLLYVALASVGAGVVAAWAHGFWLASAICG